MLGFINSLGDAFYSGFLGGIKFFAGCIGFTLTIAVISAIVLVLAKMKNFVFGD